jgi:hypothetical protein
MILHLPFGITYFTVFTVLMAVSFGLVAQPFAELIWREPIATINGHRLFFNGWIVGLGVIVGVILFFATMHLARLTGRFHGAWAKLMLVRI